MTGGVVAVVFVVVFVFVVVVVIAVVVVVVVVVAPKFGMTGHLLNGCGGEIYGRRRRALDTQKGSREWKRV